MRKYRIEIKWGFIFFGVTMLWMLLERLVGLHSTHIDKHAYYTNLYAVPAILVYVPALLDKRKRAFAGYMTYKQGFMTGLVVTAVVMLLSPVGQVIVAYAISPSYFSNAADYAVESGKLTEESAREYFNLTSYIVQSLIGALIMGLVTSAIVAIFTRKQPKAGGSSDNVANKRKAETTVAPSDRRARDLFTRHRAAASVALGGGAGKHTGFDVISCDIENPRIPPPAPGAHRCPPTYTPIASTGLVSGPD